MSDDKTIHSELEKVTIQRDELRALLERVLMQGIASAPEVEALRKRNDELATDLHDEQLCCQGLGQTMLELEQEVKEARAEAEKWRALASNLDQATTQKHIGGGQQ